MPKIYRAMKEANGKPTVGEGATDLGVRVPADILPDAAGNVWPQTGGMSVSPSLASLPPHRVPRRLHPLVPKASGKDFLFVWSMGEGVFIVGAVSADLALRPDPDDDKHGFVEPDKILSVTAYQKALAATLAEWQVDEAG